MPQLFIPSQFTNLTVEQLTPLFSSVVALFLAIMVFFQSRHLLLNILFAIFSFFISFWLFGTFMMFTSKTAELQIFWDRFIYLNVVFLPILLYQFGAAFAKIKPPRWLLIVGYSLTAFFVVISQTDYFVADLFIYKWGVHTKAQFFHHVFLIFFAIFMTRGIVFIYQRYRRVSVAEKIEKLRALYTFVAFIVLYIIGSLGYLPAYGIGIYPFAYISGVLFVLILTFTITRYELFNLKAAAAEFFVLLITLFFLSKIVTADNSQTRIMYSGFFVVALAFGYLSIQNVIKEIDQRKKLEKLTGDLKDLNDHLNQKVAEQTIEIRKSYEVEKKARVELEELDKAKDQFILTTQHHLRTPLTIVKGYISSLLDKPPETTLAESKDVLNKTSVAADRLASLVNEFLDISQMEVGKSILNKEPTNIKDIITDITKELEPEIQKKNISLAIKAENDIVLNIDPFKMKEALTNIIDNAVKYNKTGGSISVKGEKTTHPIEKDKQIYRLSIEDTGIGITKEELSKLFTQYFQRGKVAEKIYTTGRGLGLAISKNIIQAHQGRIYAESDGRDKGARFVVEMGA